LRLGDPYLGQSGGLDLRVDHSSNLRTDEGALVPAAPKLIAAIIERNPYRRARRTAAGHLIVRVDPQGSDEPDWRFLGSIDLPDERGGGTVIRLRLRNSSGKQVIALEEEPKKGLVRFALGPDSSRTPEGGDARDRLLEWTRTVEAERGVAVKEIFWDNGDRYWLEIAGQRIPYNSPLPRLEFE
jgi:hypothetical protein